MYKRKFGKISKIDRSGITKCCLECAKLSKRIKAEVKCYQGKNIEEVLKINKLEYNLEIKYLKPLELEKWLM